MDTVDITTDPISVDHLTQLVSSPKCGAISMFLGTTRDNFQGKNVIQLEYEAYEPMARKEMQKICAEVREQWSVENIAIVHRIGVVPVMEGSVAILVSSPHRSESLAAVEYAINKLKATVPIWKKVNSDVPDVCLRYQFDGYRMQSSDFIADIENIRSCMMMAPVPGNRTQNVVMCPTNMQTRPEK